MAKILTAANQKGGVGKTTTTLNLAYSLAVLGKKVLAIDFDSQANLTKCFGITKDEIKLSIAELMDLEIEDEELPPKDEYIISKHGVDIIPSTIALSRIDAKLQQSTIFAEKTLCNIIERIEKDYDYILLDTNPSLGILTINAFTATDSVIIPMNTEAMSADGLQDLLKSIRKVKKRINECLEIEGILITMADKRTNLYKEITNEVRQACENHIYVFDAQIPDTVKVGEANLHRKPIKVYLPSSPATKAYMELAEEIIKRNKEV